MVARLAGKARTHIAGLVLLCAVAALLPLAGTTVAAASGDPASCLTGSAAFDFASPLKGARVHVSVKLRRDMQLKVTLRRPDGGVADSFSRLIGTYSSGLPLTTFVVPTNELGASYVSRVEVSLEGRSPSTILSCSVHVEHEGTLDDVTAQQCFANGQINFPFTDPVNGVRVAIDLALKHDMILETQFFDASDQRVFHDYRAVGEYSTGLPLTTFVFPSSGPGINGVARAQITVSGRVLSTVRRCSATVEFNGRAVDPALTRDRSGHSHIATGRLGDPVNMATGSFELDVVDMALDGPGVPLVLSRSYNSAVQGNGSFGPGWSHPLGMRALVSNGKVTVDTEDGAQLRFMRQADGTYLPDSGVRSSLSAVEGGFELTRHDQLRYGFDSGGRLRWVGDRSDQRTTLQYDTAGRLASATDAVGRVVTFQHSVVGRRERATLPDGRSVHYGYDPSGRLASVQDVRGGTLRYRYDSAGRMTEVEDQAGNLQVRNEYDPATGRVANQWDALDRLTRFEWDPSLGEAVLVDARGNRWVERYVGNVLRERQDPLGNRTVFRYDDQLRPAEVQDAAGHTFSFGYDADHNRTRVSGPQGFEESWSYTESNLVASHTDARGQVWGFGYDGFGNLTEAQRPDGTTEFHTYDGPRRLRTSTTDGAGRTTSLAHDAVGNLVGTTTPEGRSTTMAYDQASRLSSVVDPLGATTSYAYDAAGNVISSTDPLGHIQSQTYDEVGNLTTLTDPLGRVTEHRYDAAGQRIATVAPDGALASFEYDAVGNGTAVVDPLGRRTVTSFDAVNNPVAVVSPDGATVRSSYDELGQLVSLTDPRGGVDGVAPGAYTTTFDYDALGRRISERDPLGATTTMAYDPAGNLTTRLSPEGSASSWTYDGQGRVTSVSDPEGGTTAYHYDGAGNLIERQDPLARSTTFAYDGDGHLLTSQDPAGRTWSSTVDGAGRPTTATTPNGSTTSFTYDAAGRLVTLDYDDAATPDVAYDYLADGQRLSMTDGGGTQVYAYDGTGRLASVTRNGESFTYSYDTSGQLEQRTLPDASTTTYSYAPGTGRLETVTTPEGPFTMAVDPAGLPEAIGRPDGSQETRQHDAAGRVLGQQTMRPTPPPEGDPTGVGTDGLVPPVPDRTYGFHPAGTLAQRSLGTEAMSFGYDRRGQVTQACPGGDCAVGSTWAYDAMGNRTSAAGSAGTTTYDYDGSDRLVSVAGPAGTLGATHDANGNLMMLGGDQFRYDAANRLVEVVTSDDQGVTRTVGYTYDGDGNRLTRTLDGQETTRYSWDVNAPLPLLALEKDPTGGLLRRYGYGQGLAPLSLATPGGQFVYHSDALGSVLGLTTLDGEPAAAYRYDPWGKLEHQEGPAAGLNPMRFAGLHLDEVSGLYDARARTYAPQLGRFLQPDPWIRPPGTPWISPYAYADNSPTSLVDPSGLRPNCGVFGWTGAALSGGDCSLSARHVGAELAGMVTGAAVGAGCLAVTRGIGFNWCVGAASAIGGGVHDWMDGESGTSPFSIRRRGLDMALGVGTAALGGWAANRLSALRRPGIAPNTAGARFVAGSDGVVTDLVGAAPNAVSIGHNPAYVNAGARTGARTFSVSDEAWNAMSPTEQWVRNQRFLDRAMAQGSEIRLATPVDLARPGSFFERELQYLFKHGYAPSADGTMLVRGGL